MLDITETGPVGLKGLKGIDTMKDAEYEEYLASFSTPSMKEIRLNRMPSMGQTYETYTGQDLGLSIYDKGIYNLDEISRVGDVRAENQPWYSQISNGLAKGAVLAGTTFLDGTIGLTLGSAQAIQEGRFSAIWDNPFSKVMQSINQWSEEAMPNYYTEAEQNTPWYENIFTSNFIGDKFIKNLGFSVGAIYSGGVTSAALKATKLPQLIGAITKMSKAPAIVSSAVGATISAVNEGRVEALNNSTDWFNAKKVEEDDKHMERLNALNNIAGSEMYEQLVAQENANYEAIIGKLTEDRLKIGNADLLMNIPILTASNILQFGKMYANGFKTARKAMNIIGKSGEYASSKTTGKGVARALLNPMSEGIEEISQGAASRIAGDYYSDDVDNFYRAKIDPNAEQKTLNWIKSFAQGINETVNEGSSWEEFFIGTLTGALGIPGFRSVTNSEGKFQNPFKIEGGSWNEFKDYREEMERESNIASYMNSRVKSPEFKNYYQGLIRHNKYQAEMDRAAEEGNNCEFKNAEHSQLVSDVAMFDNAGKIDEFNALIEAAFDTSDENLQAIIDNTTSTVTSADGKISKVGPFVDSKGNAMNSTEEGKKQMIEKITKTKDEMLETVNNYVKDKNDIDNRVGQQISDEQLEELTWLKAKGRDWRKRANELVGEIKPAIGTIIGTLSEIADTFNAVKIEEGKSHTGITELYETSEKNERATLKNIEILEHIKGLNNDVFAFMISTDPKVAQAIKEIIKDPMNGIAADEAEALEQKVDDLIKISKATRKFNDKLKEYLSNPSKISENNTKTLNNIAKQEADKKNQGLKDKLLSAATLSDFRNILDSEEDSTMREEVLNTLDSEGNQMAKDYKEVSVYNFQVQNAINALDEDSSIKSDALKLLQDQFENSSNLNELANPNSIYIDNPDALYDNSLTPEQNLTKFYDAQYALLRAMNKVNNDNLFKERFTAEYKTLREKGKANPNAPKKDTTGDSGTATIPPVSGTGLPINTYIPPVGDVTTQEVKDENKAINDNITTPKDLEEKSKGGRQFYRPAIPQLHIEGSKEGDFRPFNEVVKEREKGSNFDIIYKFLENKGTFTYVNDGKLKEGEELQFMISDEFEELVKNEPWHTRPTIFLVTKDGQIVGSLDAGKSVASFVGLESLEEKIMAEYNKASKSEDFIATPTTKVSKIMIGKVPYGTEEKNLADIPNVTNNTSLKFAIVKNGTLATNNSVDDDLIVKPMDMSSKEGRLYMLIPNGAGKYSPVAVRVKHFNTTEFNPSDVLVQNTAIFKDIQSAIEAFANSTDGTDLSKAVSLLSSELYTGDLHIDWVTSDKGTGIRFTKVQRDSNGNEIYEEKEGKRIRREDTKVVFLSEKWDPNTVFSITGNDEIKTAPDAKNQNEVIKEITNVLLSFNLPLQVNLGMINSTGYNNRLINSGILTSNISDARVVSNWFTTDYFDDKGALQSAKNPESLSPSTTIGTVSPVEGNEGAISGTKVNVGKGYYVDVTTNTIKDSNGKTVTISDNTTRTRILEIAWAQNTFGNATSSSLMMNNKVLTPSGKVLDRNTNQYLSDKEAAEFITKLKNRGKKVKNSEAILSSIYDNQSKVDKSKTDQDYYYILEDDGQYHPYDRVHSRIGSNWKESDRQIKALKDIGVKLSELVNNPTQYNNYLQYLSNHYKADVLGFKDKLDAKSRDSIVNKVRDAMNGTNSGRALNAGTAIDTIIRDFFTSSESPKKPDNMSESAFADLISALTEIKSNIEARGERFLTNNIVLFQKYPDGSRIAGEVDILSIDNEGNFRIYDVKTSKYSFHDFVDKYGNKVNYFRNKSNTQNMSTEAYYTLQLSAYKNLFESQYGTPVVKLALLPFQLDYEKDTVIGVHKESGISIMYNPSVNVPLVGKKAENKAASTTSSTLPIFDSIYESHNPINKVLPENEFLSGGVIGYYEKDGKLYKGYLKHVGNIGGVDIYLTKERDRGFGRKGEINETSSYYVILPNGKLVNTRTLSKSDDEATAVIMEALNAKPQKVKNLASEKTMIYKEAKSGQEEGNKDQKRDNKNNEFSLDEVSENYTPKGIEGVDFVRIKRKSKLVDKEIEYIVTVRDGKIYDWLLINTDSKMHHWEDTSDIHSEDIDKVKSLLGNKDTTKPKEETSATVLETSTYITGAAKAIQAEIAISHTDEEFEDEFTLRRVDDDTKTDTWDEKKELAWLDKVLPQLSKDNRVRVVKGLIHVGSQGTKAWGQFNNGIVTLSDISAKGTTYHEAFHVVFNLLLDNEERQSLYNEAKEMYGDKSDLELEESMAEGFRNYVESRDSNNLLKRIRNFFKDLWIKVVNWKRVQPHLLAYYQMINEGKYSDRRIIVPSISAKEILKQTFFESLDNSIKEALLKKGWTKDKFNSVSQEERDQAVKCMSL